MFAGVTCGLFGYLVEQNEIVFQEAVVRVVDVVNRAKVLACNWFAVRTKGVKAYCWVDWCISPVDCLVNH